MSCNFDLHCIPPLKGVLVPPPWKFLPQTEQVSDCVHYQCATPLRGPPGGWFLAPVSQKLIGKNYSLDSAISFPNIHPLDGDLSNWGQGPFLERPVNFLGMESCFMFAMFAFKIKVSIIKYLKMMQWNYQLNKAKLTDLWVRNYATILQVLILKFEFGL